MTKKYIVENGCSLPLCCVDNGVYFDYMTGLVIDNPNTINFIKEGLKRKSMKVEDIDLVIYKIIKNEYEWGFRDDPLRGKTMEPFKIDESIIAYNYVINGCSNYLDENKQPLTNDKRQYIIDKLMKGEYEQVIIWE